jgi:RNA polymerase sigma-70 factor (ECF subfamily)
LINKSKSFKKIFNEYYSPLCNYALKITNNKEEAEDIVIDLFANFWESNTLERIENIERYLLRSVKFKSIDYLRKSTKYKSIKIFDIKDQISEFTNDFAEAEIDSLLAYFSSKLPTKTRQVFLLSRRSGKSYRQIAEELKISIKTVEAQMGRALKLMRTYLKEFGFLSIFI